LSNSLPRGDDFALSPPQGPACMGFQNTGIIGGG
jgi:hypothetical protein